MTLSPAIARQYLKAMGIESWVSRDAIPEMESVPAAIVSAVQPESGADAQLAPICQSSVGDLLQALADKPVQTVRVADARILLLLESPTLEEAGHNLLKSMLKAIDVDLDEQCFGYFSPAQSATGNVRSFVGNVQPAIIIVMANFIQSADELATHRAGLHRLAWFGAPVAVTMHPNALIHNPALKRPAWEDLKRVKASLDG